MLGCAARSSSFVKAFIQTADEQRSHTWRTILCAMGAMLSTCPLSTRLHLFVHQDPFKAYDRPHFTDYALAAPVLFSFMPLDDGLHTERGQLFSYTR